MIDPNHRGAGQRMPFAIVGALASLALLAFAADGGINGGGRARGTLTAFGSIFVNGVEYDMSSALVSIDDEPGAESGLAVGQVVTVDGFVNGDGTTGRADSVEFESDVRGSVASLSATATSFVVLGQTVLVNGGTRFDSAFVPGNFSGLEVGQVVEVSGFRSSTGELVATHVGLEDDPDDRVVGLVEALDSDILRFQVNDLQVDYSGAIMVDPGLANGALVEVEGLRGATGVLDARTVELEDDDIAGDDGQGASLEGIITAGLLSGQFAVNGQPVVVNRATRYQFGKRRDLKPNARVEAEGRFDAAGRIVASKVVFKYEDDAYAFAVVDSVEPGTRTVRLVGLTITVDSSAKIEDKSAQQQRPFSLRNLQPGDTVEIRGVEMRLPRSVRALELRREDADGRTRIGGRVSAIRNREFDVLDLTVTTSSATRYRDEFDRAISAAKFFAIAANREVKVRGTWDGTAFRAVEVEFEELHIDAAGG